MKWENAGLWFIIAFAAWGGWMALDMSSAGASSSGTLAVARGASVPVLVEFYADWCAPCRAVGPVVDALAAEVAPRARVIRINVDQDPAAAQECGIKALPAFIAYRSGQEVRREYGAIPRQVMKEMIGL